MLLNPARFEASLSAIEGELELKTMKRLILALLFLGLMGSVDARADLLSIEQEHPADPTHKEDKKGEPKPPKPPAGPRGGNEE